MAQAQGESGDTQTMEKSQSAYILISRNWTESWDVTSQMKKSLKLQTADWDGTKDAECM